MADSAAGAQRNCQLTQPGGGLHAAMTGLPAERLRGAPIAVPPTKRRHNPFDRTNQFDRTQQKQPGLPVLANPAAELSTDRS